MRSEYLPAAKHFLCTFMYLCTCMHRPSDSSQNDEPLLKVRKIKEHLNNSNSGNLQLEIRGTANTLFLFQVKKKCIAKISLFSHTLINSRRAGQL